MKFLGHVCDSCPATSRWPLEGEQFVPFRLPEGWVSVKVELGSERVDPAMMYGAKLGEYMGTVTESIGEEEGPDKNKKLGEVMGKAMADLTKFQPMSSPSRTFEFCADCARELVVTMKGNSLLAELAARRAEPKGDT